VLSHELRNPLAPLLNGLAILKLRNDPETAARTHAMMERQIGQLRRLIDDPAGREPDRFAASSSCIRNGSRWDALVRNAIETAKPSIEAKQHALEVRYAREPLYVDADAVRLGQVVAQPAQQPRPSSRRRTGASRSKRARGGPDALNQRPGQRRRLLVRGRRAHLSSPSFNSTRVVGQAAGARARTYAWCALSCGCMAAACMQRATVSAREPNSPSVCRLPLRQAPRPRPSLPPRSDLQPAPGLVVDDNVDAADTLAQLLRIEGFNARKSHNGAEALAIAQDFQPQVAFVDVNMPGMSGFQVAAALRAQPWAAGLRLVALTGMGQKADLDATRAAGVRRASHETGVRRRDPPGGQRANPNVLQFNASRRAEANPFRSSLPHILPPAFAAIFSGRRRD
jgi:CheY-like chemotaxis protein